MTGTSLREESAQVAIARLLLQRSGVPWTLSTQYPDGTRGYWFSDAFIELTGYRPADFERGGFGVLAGPLTDPDAYERGLNARRDGGVLEMVLHRADGTPFWDRMVISPVAGASDPTWLILHEDATANGGVEDGHASLIDKLYRAERRAALLSRVFEDVSNTTDRMESFERVLGLTVPEFADWACVFRHEGKRQGVDIVAAAGGPPERPGLRGDRIVAGDSFATLNHPSPDDVFVPCITEDWLDQMVSASDYPIARQMLGASLIAVPIRGFGPSYGALVQVTYGGRPYDLEDFETAKVIGSRLGVMVENLEWASSDTRRVQTIETAVFAPPAQFPGLDVAVEVGPPLPSDPYVTWCDAFPLAGGVEGFVISQVYATGMAATENVAMQRASIRALLWNNPCAGAALADNAELAYAVNPDPLGSSGQIATISPTEAGVTLDVATVAHLPVVVREPNWGFRTLEGSCSAHLGAAGVPMFSTREELARGSVVFFLSDAALGGMSGSEADELENLIAAWKELAEDSPAEAYAEIVREHASKTMWKRRLCFVIVRVPTQD